MEFLSQLTDASSRTALTPENLEHVEKIFREATHGQMDEIHLEDFSKIVKSKNIFFTERVFSVFDRDGSGSVSLEEYLDAIAKFVGQTPDDKINFLFKIYDIDGDGYIQHEELRHVMRACMEENGMRFSEEQIEDLTTALFEDADPTNTGAITFEALKAQLAKHESLLENLSTSIERWLVPSRPQPPPSLRERIQSHLPHWASWRFVKNNHVFLKFLGVFVFINIALLGSRAYQYRCENVFVVFARVCGQALNFTCTMILVFMLRNCITWLRSNGMSSYLPLDDHIVFHKLTGALIVIFAAIHSVMHICNYNELASVANSTYTVVDYLFTSKPHIGGLLPGYASITGILLVLVLLIMALCSLGCVRQSGKFEVFYWTHQLYAAFWILLIFHAPNFWKWFIAPAVIYVLECIMRFVRLSISHGQTIITEGVLLPSKVTHLVIRRPAHFDYCPGDYIFVRIPVIAQFEWHPFTLSSAPEQEDFLWLHVRAVGEWTNRLHEYVEKQQKRNLEGLHTVVIEKSGPGANAYTENITKNESLKWRNVRNDHSNENGIAETTLMVPSAIPIRLTSNQTSLTTWKSLPDVAERLKQRQKLFTSRENPRSLSMKCFDEFNLKETKIVTNGTLYRHHRDSWAQSSKYLRRKPNVVHLSPNPDECSEKENVQHSELRAVHVSSPNMSGNESIKELESGFADKPLLKIYLDGPFGAPSSHIFRAQHAVLIATGIGVTPFASILQSIMRRYWKERHTCPRCEHSWTGQIPRSVMNLRKVDFFWINRDQRSFEWFVNLLSQLEIEQAELGGAMERFLDMHMYITSALQRSDMKALGLQLALDLLHEREKRDLITGLKTRTQAGRPNWTKVFKQISEEKKGKVTVFYCGPPQLGRSLQVKCDEFGFTFRKEVF